MSGARRPASGVRPGDPARIVPATGLSSWLYVCAVGAMVFLATLALAAACTTYRLAQGWQAEIAQSMTIRIDAPADRMDALSDQALRLLETTPGVARAEVLDGDMQAQLLERWLPDPGVLAGFDLPRLIALEPVEGLLDVQSLALRLEGEVPGATLDDHSAWLEPLRRGAVRLAQVSLAVVAVSLLALVAVILIAAQAALAANRGIIQTLRLLGARDRFIARAFVRRLSWRAVFGALGGVACAAACLVLAPVVWEGPGGPYGFVGLEWAAALALVPMTGILAGGASLLAARLLMRSAE